MDGIHLLGELFRSLERASQPRRAKFHAIERGAPDG
jgi:hypothetical protein